MEFVAFGKTAENLLECKDEETAVLLNVRIRKEEDRVRASLAEIKRMITHDEMIREQRAHWKLELCLDLDTLDLANLQKVKQILEKYSGSNSIQLIMKKIPWVLRAGTPLQVEKSQALLQELETIVGSQLIGWKRCLS
jgi:DNA polymerase III alpha subunit